MNLTDNRFLRVSTLCGLYAAQGIPFGFVTVALVAYFGTRGFSPAQVAEMLAISTWPWALKWIWGPIVDRFNIPSMGRRRPWILLAQFMMVLTIAAMLFLDNMAEQMEALALLVFIHNAFNALQDVSVDALAVDILSEGERGKVNGLMFGSKYIGTILGGMGLISIITSYGMHTALIVQAGTLLCIMMLPLLLREKRGEKLMPWSSAPEPDIATNPTTTPGSEPKANSRLNDAASSQIKLSTKELFISIFQVFKLRSAFCALLLGFMIYVGPAILYLFDSTMTLQELNWNEKVFGQVIGLIAMIFSALGCFFGGALADKFGVRKVLGTSVVLLSTVWITSCFTASYSNYRPYYISLSILAGILIGVSAVSFFSLAMSVSWPKVAATQFCIYMAVMNLATVAGYKICGVFDSCLDGVFPVQSTSGAIDVASNPVFDDPNRFTLGPKLSGKIHDGMMTLLDPVTDPNQLADISRKISSVDPNSLTGGFALDGIPYRWMKFVTASFVVAIINLLAIIPLLFIDPHQTRKVLGSDTDEKS